MKNRFALLIVVFFAFSCAGCSGSHQTNRYRKPSSQKILDTKNLLYVIQYKGSFKSMEAGGELRVSESKSAMATGFTTKDGRLILFTVKHAIEGILGNTSNLPFVYKNETVDVFSWYDGKKEKAEVVYVDPDRDIAFLSIPLPENYVLPQFWTDENQLINLKVFSNKKDLDKTEKRTEGSVISFVRYTDADGFIASMPVEYGFSGTGVFDEMNVIVGMVVAQDKKLPTSFLISAPRILEAYQKYLKNI